MIQEINTDNRDQILRIMRSAVVCVDMMLAYGNDELKSLLTSGQSIKDILLAPAFQSLRNELLQKLNYGDRALYFKHLLKFRKLDINTQAMTNDLFAALYECDINFITELFDILKKETIITKLATRNLLLKAIHNRTFNADYESIDNSENCGYGPGYYGGYYGCGYRPVYANGTYYGPVYYGPTYYGSGYYGPGYYAGGYYGPSYYSGYDTYGCAYYGGGYDFTDVLKLLQSITNSMDLHDESQLELFQALHSPGGISNAQGKSYGFKPGECFDQNQAKGILYAMQSCSGDHHEKMFRAIAKAAAADPSISAKLRLIPGK